MVKVDREEVMIHRPESEASKLNTIVITRSLVPARVVLRRYKHGKMVEAHMTDCTRESIIDRLEEIMIRLDIP